MDEIWKRFEDSKYFISNFGKIKNENTGRILKQCFSNDGYLIVCLYIRKKQKTFCVHKLVAEAFIGKCLGGKEVNHIDGTKINNYIGNLEYITHKENIRHAHKMGLLHNNKGEGNGNSKFSDKDIVRIRKIYKESKIPQRKLAKRYGVCRQTISYIVANKTWSHVK